jgi:ribosomal protein S27AE
VPDPPYTVQDMIYEKTTKVSVIISLLVMAFCAKCSGGKILSDHVKRAKPKK